MTESKTKRWIVKHSSLILTVLTIMCTAILTVMSASHLLVVFGLILILIFNEPYVLFVGLGLFYVSWISSKAMISLCNKIQDMIR